MSYEHPKIFIYVWVRYRKHDHDFYMSSFTSLRRPYLENVGKLITRTFAKSDLGLLVEPGKSYRRGRLSTVDLLVLTSLDRLLFILKILLNSFTKQATLMRRSTVLSIPRYLVFPG
jgi:hypothetical protein